LKQSRRRARLMEGDVRGYRIAVKIERVYFHAYSVT